MAELRTDFFTWRRAVLKSDLAPTTKHILLTLSCYVSDMGTGVYPSTRRLAEDTSLSERSVITHIDLAKKAGWITVHQHAPVGKGWRRNEYILGFPKIFYGEHGAERPSVPSCGEQTPPQLHVVVEENPAEPIETDGAETRSAPRGEGAEPPAPPSADGAEPNSNIVLKEVQSKYPEEAKSKNSLSACARESPIGPDWKPSEALLERTRVSMFRAGMLASPGLLPDLSLAIQKFIAAKGEVITDPDKVDSAFVKWILDEKELRHGKDGSSGRRVPGRNAARDLVDQQASRRLSCEEA